MRATIRRVPAETLSSWAMRNKPIWPVLVTCVPPHSSLLKSPMLTMRTTSGYFSPNSIIAPAVRASAIGRCFQLTGSAARTRVVHFVFDFRERLLIDRGGIGEIEPEPIVVDFRALLLGVLAQELLQGVVQNMRGGVRAANSRAAVGIDFGGHARPSFKHAFAQMAAVQHEAFFAVRVDDFESQARADDFAGVADLAARFAVKRRLIEHDRDRLLRGRSRPSLRTDDLAR